MKKTVRFLVLCLSFWCGATLFAKSGQVFFDADGNGRRDPGEPGVAGVVVTDGVDLVKTDADGNFSLEPAPSARFLYITVPDGYRAKDRFYRTLDEEPVFPLVKWSGRPRRFVQISDGEVAVKRAWMKEVDRELREHPADFLIYTGDIAANNPDGLVFAARRFTFENMGVPVHFTIGNHDFTKGKSGDDAYMTRFGPLWYSFDSNGVHFIVAPMHWDGLGQRRDKPVTYKPNDYAEWIRRDLELQPAGKPVVMFAHAPIMDIPGVKETIRPERFNIKAFIHGHTHMCAAYDLAGIRHHSVSSVKDGMPFAAIGVYEIAADGTVRRLPHPVDAKFSAPAESDSRLKWRASAPGNCYMADPVVAEDRVYVGKSDVFNGEHQCVMAFDRKTGAQLWRFPTVGSVHGTMVLSDGTLYVADSEGYVYALSAADGKQLWRTRFTERCGVYYCQGVVLHDGEIIAGYGDDLRAFRTADGRQLWHTKGKKGKKVRWGNGAGNIAAGELLICGDAGRRSASDIKTGKLRWQGGKYNFFTPGYADGKLYALCGKEWCELDMATGKEVRKMPNLPGHWNGRGTPAITGGVLYAGTFNGGVIAIDLASGKLKWRFLPGYSRAAVEIGRPQMVAGRTIFDGGRVFFGAMDGKVYALDAADGKELWSYDTGTPVSGVTCDRGELMVTDFAGNLYKFDVSDLGTKGSGR